MELELSEDYTAIDAALSSYNEELTALQEHVQEQINFYNNSLSELRSFAENIAAERRNEYGGKVTGPGRVGINGQAAGGCRSLGAMVLSCSCRFPRQLCGIGSGILGPWSLPTEP